MIGGSGGSKSRLAKAAGVRSHLARWEMKSCTLLWREARFQVKMNEAHHARTTFGSCDVEKVHAIVAWSTSPSQNVKSTRCSDYLWTFRVEKVHAVVARKCLSKSKVLKDEGFGPLLDVQMSFSVAGTRDCAPCFVAASTKTTALLYTTLHSTPVHSNYIYSYNDHCNYTTLNSSLLLLHSTTLHYV